MVVKFKGVEFCRVKEWCVIGLCLNRFIGSFIGKKFVKMLNVKEK